MNKLPHIDEYQTMLESDMRRQFGEINLSVGTFNQIVGKILGLINSSITAKGYTTIFLAKIGVSSSGVIVDDMGGLLMTGRDYKIRSIVKLLQSTIDWAILHHLPVPNTTLFFWLHNHPLINVYPEEITDFPLFVYTKTLGQKSILFPDTTYNSFNVYLENGGPCLPWDEQRQLINRNIGDAAKIDKVYFRGEDAFNAFGSDIRRMLFENKHKDWVMKLHPWLEFGQVWDWSEYWYILNLPNRGNWSYMLKYLLMMKSLVISVNLVNTKLDGYLSSSPMPSGKNISFVDYVLVPGIDYVEIQYKYYGCFSDYPTRNISKQVNEEDKKLLGSIEKAHKYYSEHSYERREIAKNGARKVEQLTESRIYQYMYVAMVLNRELFGTKKISY